MSDQTKNEKPTSETYAERLARMEKELGVVPMNLPKGWARAIIPMPDLPPEDKEDR